LALARAAQSVAERHDPAGPQHLTAVPTVVRCGDAFNVVPATGELLCDLRADGAEAFDAVLQGLPEAVDGVRLEPTMQRCWPGLDARAATVDLLASAGARLGRPVMAAERGGASDASYMAQAIDVTVDGLGPLGGEAHAPGEYILEKSLRTRAEVALALVDAVLSQ
ncbi:MAG: M20/M25/M40 family metallo-hydrolase, partial [Solirubrobacteraceae bacterium]